MKEKEKPEEIKCERCQEAIIKAMENNIIVEVITEQKIYIKELEQKIAEITVELEQKGG